MREFTRKEKDAINTAWAFLSEAGRYDMKRDLLAALKEERKSRSSLVYAKAMLITSFCGIPPKQNIEELAYLSSGNRTAYIWGKEFRKNNTRGYAEIQPRLEVACNSLANSNCQHSS